MVVLPVVLLLTVCWVLDGFPARAAAVTVPAPSTAANASVTSSFRAMKPP
jgi:hypothetical protein